MSRTAVQNESNRPYVSNHRGKYVRSIWDVCGLIVSEIFARQILFIPLGINLISFDAITDYVVTIMTVWLAFWS